jgi:PAS domain S-box-containing protein
VRVEDIACRWGGEEFIVLLPNTTSEAAVVLADRIRSSFEQFPRTATPVVTASFGVARLLEGENENALISRVDDALYQAKHEGRNRVVTACDVPVSSIMMTKTAEAAWNLRQRAEEQLQSDMAMHTQPLFPLEQEKQLHELRVHQVELEIQNEELRHSQEELDAERGRYCDLYNLAPFGYLTISAKKMIKEVNIAAASMFGDVRSLLVKEPICRILPIEGQYLFYQHLKQCSEVGEFKELEMRLVRVDGKLFWAHLQVALIQNGEYWIALRDITEQKRAELELLERIDRFERSAL